MTLFRLLILSAVYHGRPVMGLEQQEMDLVDQEFQSVLDVSSLLKLSATGDHMKDNREGEAQGYEYNQKSLFPFFNVYFTFVSVLIQLTFLGLSMLLFNVLSFSGRKGMNCLQICYKWSRTLNV